MNEQNKSYLEYNTPGETKAKLEYRIKIIATCFRGSCLFIITLFLMGGFVYVISQKDFKLMDKLLPLITALLGYITGRSSKT